MYQDPAEKRVETKREITTDIYLVGRGTMPFIWWGAPKKFLAGHLFGGKMWPGQKNPSGPFIKKNKNSAPLADPLFGVNSGPFIESKKSQKS